MLININGFVSFVFLKADLNIFKIILVLKIYEIRTFLQCFKKNLSINQEKKLRKMNPNLYQPASITYKDLLLRKLYYSVICSVLSQLFLLQTYIFISNFDLLHPLEWIWATFRTFTSVSTWLFLVPFVSITFAQSIICAKDYIMRSNYSSTRFQKFISLFSAHNFVLLLLNIIVGSTLIWLFLSLGGGYYQSLTTTCKETLCLSEGTFFLILGGFWIGFYYFIKVYVSEKHLSFPVIHQRKLLQLKSRLVPLLKESVTSSLLPTVYYTVFYYFWGQNISEAFRTLLGFEKDGNLGGILVYMHLWVFGALIYFNLNLMKFFFNLHLTEPVEFPLFKEAADSLCLQDGLNMAQFPILQNLACWDLRNLAQWSKSRRQVFFTLSQPGGHPYNWNLLVENVLKLLKEYTELLNKSIDVSDNLKPQAPVSSPIVAQSPIQSPDRFHNLRNMSLITDSGMLDVVNVTYPPVMQITFMDTLFEKIKSKLSSFLAFLKVILGINFIFGELPQANVQKCLANGNVIIWTAQGISDLTCSSISEDRFGIAQKDLPGILTTLVQLKQSLDKLHKMSALTRKVAGYDDFNFRMKNAVNASVKRSLYNLCRTYGSYLNDFPLKKDILLYLQGVYKNC